MDVRDKLVELIIKSGEICYSHTAEELASHLIDNGVTVQEWISVKDRLPDETKDEYVLVVCDYHGKIKVETRKMWHIDSVVTHWMPLPQPLKGE
jgi:hypothetical protein